ncbi:MAG: ATP-binding protein [Deltaproteobacteria bacterium]|nr:ATP-binding protein [Deltaproteobacteria bacterium]
MVSDRLADYLQIWGVEENFVVFADGSLGFGLNALPVDSARWDDDRTNSFSERVGQFLNGLPEGLSLQFCQEIDGGNAGLLKQHLDLAAAGSEMGQRLASDRVERLEALDANGAVPVHRLRVFVRRKTSAPLLGKPRLFSRSRQFEKLSEEQLRIEMERLGQVRDTMIHGLRQLGIEAKVLAAGELLDLIYKQWNPERGVSRPSYDPTDVRSSLLFTDVALSTKGFALGSQHYRVLSLKLLPDATVAAMAARLRELPFGSKLMVSIQTLNQLKELERLKGQRRIAFSMARGKSDEVSDLESASKLENLGILIEQMIADGEKVFKVALNIILCGASEGELDQQASEALSKLRELGGCEGIEETVANFDIFASIAIPNARAKERLKHIKTSNLADLLPLYGPWRGHSTPRVLLRSRLGSLVSFDPFSPGLTNANQIVSGGSGAGKSFLTNICLLHILKEAPKIFVIDIGGSYRKLCDHLGGQFIPLGLDGNLCLNPFDLSAGSSAPSNEKIKFLVSLVELMTKEEGDTRLPKLERAEIEEAIQKVYAGSEPRLSDLRNVLSEHSNVEIRRFGRILAPWCGNTPYGKFLDAKTNMALSRPIVVFDLKGMESHPDLQAAALFMITDFVWREVQRDPLIMKFLVLDECWRLLEAGSGFIEEVFRTFRKYNASSVAISQNIDDFAKSKVAGAILSNSATKWVLMQKGADQKRLKEVLQLNDNEMKAVASLKQERGVYSEAFLIAGDERAVVAVESTPLEYWLATTDPKDVAEIAKASADGKSDVLKDLSERYPRGVSQQKKGVS